MCDVAGLVPCAVSGTMTSVRFLSFCASKYARAAKMPVSSPCAPAAGCSVNAARPVISLSISCRLYKISSVPCTASSGAKGWALASGSSTLNTSYAFGLYFIVQEPSG